MLQFCPDGGLLDDNHWKINTSLWYTHLGFPIIRADGLAFSDGSEREA